MLRRSAILLALTACAPTLTFNQSFLVPEELKLAPNGYASLKSTGESFDLGPIRAQEKKAEAGVSVLKVHGAFILVGDGFQHAWRLWPAGKDEMHYAEIDLSPGPKGFSSPTLELSGNCALLKWQKSSAPAQAYVNSDGDADEKKCD